MEDLLFKEELQKTPLYCDLFLKILVFFFLLLLLLLLLIYLFIFIIVPPPKCLSFPFSLINSLDKFSSMGEKKIEHLVIFRRGEKYQYV